MVCHGNAAANCGQTLAVTICGKQLNKRPKLHGRDGEMKISMQLSMPGQIPAMALSLISKPSVLHIGLLRMTKKLHFNRETKIGKLEAHDRGTLLPGETNSELEADWAQERREARRRDREHLARRRRKDVLERGPRPLSLAGKLLYLDSSVQRADVGGQDFANSNMCNFCKSQLGANIVV